MCAICLTATSAQRFKVLYEWSYINFTWLNPDALHTAVSLGQYLPENNIISGIKYYDKWMYLTLPRMKQGVPATLARILANTYENDTEPLLEPYPSWNMNLEGDCSAFQNVQNVEINLDGKMWILDTGRTATMTKFASSTCKPRLIIYDIKNNLTITNYYFPEPVVNNRSYLYDLVLDDVDGGYAYITDNSGTDPGLIVYSLKQGKSWKIRDNATMRASADAIDFRVSGTAVSTPINLAGIALGTRTISSEKQTFVSQDRSVYFCPLSSTRLYSIQSSELRIENNPNIKIKDLGKKSSTTDGMVMDENGILYYGLLADNSIATWNSKTLFTSGQKVIARDPIHIQWADSLAFDDLGHLLVVTNKLQKFIFGQINITEPNYRILEAVVNAKSYLYGVPQEEPYRPEKDHTQTSGLGIASTKNNFETTTGSYDNHMTTQSAITNSTNIEKNVIPVSSAVYLKDNLFIVLTVLCIWFLQ